ncbi:AMP-binding protein [Sulfitobacter sp. HNIBRBA3233]|uniref:AMP-binding protein n=1 Tax=Sulfitobacter marinivivus TaxID=3158558 RepID=UPI0032DECA60
MEPLLSPTAPARFALHPQARVFAGDIALAPAPAPEDRWIGPAPLAQRLAAVMGAVAQGVPFCLSDTRPAGLHRLGPDRFATLTGGSAGRPKVVARSQASWTASFEIAATRFGIGPRDSVAVIGDPVHSLALYAAVEAMHLGAGFHALGDLAPQAQAARMRAAGTSVLYATPTQLRVLAARNTDPLPGLRLILCGGGTLDAVTRGAVAAMCPKADMHVFYGAAETSFITLADAQTPPGSVGRAYPGVEMRLTGDTIAVRSPYLFDGYLQGESAHTRWLDGGWLTLGEYGRRDAAGYLYLRGRAGRMITVADRSVSLDEITDHLAPLAHPRHLAVMARADGLRGHRIAVAVSGVADDALAQRLSEACRAEFGVGPQAVRAFDPFPLLPSGKPDLAALERLV